MALNLTPIAALRARLLAAQEEEGNAILTVSNERIPVADGIAQKSGRVVPDEATGTTTITYGRDDDGTGTHAASNTYIEKIHEDMEMAHPHGGQAKFLQSAADEVQTGMVERIAMKAMVT